MRREDNGAKMYSKILYFSCFSARKRPEVGLQAKFVSKMMFKAIILQFEPSNEKINAFWSQIGTKISSKMIYFYTFFHSTTAKSET
jgi:hypothetical protein